MDRGEADAYNGKYGEGGIGAMASVVTAPMQWKRQSLQQKWKDTDK